MSTKAFNPRCKINFGNLTYRILAPTFSHPRSYSQGENYRNHVVMLGCPMDAWSSLPFVQTFRNLRPAGLWGENSCGSRPTDATVAIIMHCSYGQKNYGNMSIEKLSPLSGNK